MRDVTHEDQDRMYQTVDQVLQALIAEIMFEESSILTKKETINTLCTAVGRPPAYTISNGDRAK